MYQIDKIRLTKKQARFIEEYLIDLNATQAAIRAGYSVKTAGEIGHENLKKPQIQVEIDKAIKARSKRVQITQDRVLKEYACLAFFDPRKMFNDNGSLKLLKDMDDDTAAALSSFEIDITKLDDKVETSTAKLKFWDKLRGLNDLAKHLGMF
jgi:phage terminase small subunit